MNILGMGPLEILLILVIALIVFGPAKLPEIMGQVGRAIAEFRRMTSSLSDEFNRTIQAELQETRALVDDTRSAVTGVHTSINSAITGTPAPVRTAAPGDSITSVGSTTPTNGTNAANGTTTQTAPPLADTSQWSWETPAAVGVGAASATVAAATEPAVEQAPEPQIPPPARRKTSPRDDILPPY
jgi:TatA/E family protein of Tat protein translocase